MGRFFFAWVDAAETAFGIEHEREDEQIFALEIAHREGEFPAATIEIENPRVGLLAPARKTWAWVSWDAGGSTGVVPLFFGRLVAVPEELQGEIVRLQFIARPQGYDDLRRTLAATLKVAPYWDALWIPPERRDDPDAVLEARSAHWHIDRITHAVTISDVIAGEDGLLDLGSDADYGDLSISYRQVPVRRVKVDASIFWDQEAIGRVDFAPALLAAAADADSGNGHNIDTYTGEGLARDWPEPGAGIRGGWSVGDSYVIRGDGRWVPVTTQRVILADGGVADFPSWSFKPVFAADYNVARSRIEHLTFTLQADVQALLTEPGDEETILLTLASQDAGEPIDAPFDSDGIGTAPIGDKRRRSYLLTDRGRQSLEYLIALARAHLLFRARAVEVSFGTSWANGLGLSCRKNARVADPRLPGGEATGKVVAYSLIADGDSGELSALVTIGCTIGAGNTVSAADGNPDYADTGYADTGYQTYTGHQVMPIAGEVTYEDFSAIAPNDDGIDFFNMSADGLVQAITIEGTKAEQRSVLQAFKADLQAAIDALNEVYTKIIVELQPVDGGPFTTEFPIEVSQLMVPKTIDLEAS